jgi:hypothetical protein
MSFYDDLMHIKKAVFTRATPYSDLAKVKIEHSIFSSINLSLGRYALELNSNLKETSFILER